jgi:divalent metal cation (Fe/Co/Zn/Cd) transporter
MNIAKKAWFIGLVILFACSSLALAQSKGYLWDGTHWKDLTQEIKVAYIKGVGNMADFEVGVGGSGRAGCISKAFVDELKAKTVAQIVQEVDKYYQENPNKMKTSVIEVVLRRCTALCPPETKAAEKKK